MKINFNVNESIVDIVNNTLKSDDQEIEIEFYSTEKENIYKIDIKDKYFDSWGNLYVDGIYENDKFIKVSFIKIETAWSGFTYEIIERIGVTQVTYIGPYLGLLSQNLIPKLTPINLLQSKITSSISCAKTLEEYVNHRKKIVELKKTIGDDSYVQEHPKVIYDLLK